MRLSRFSFLGVVATNVLGNVWKSDNDDIENTATSDTDLLVLKGQVKMELLERVLTNLLDCRSLSVWIAMADLSLL